jgi:hypothetical protein
LKAVWMVRVIVVKLGKLSVGGFSALFAVFCLFSCMELVWV